MNILNCKWFLIQKDFRLDDIQNYLLMRELKINNRQFGLYTELKFSIKSNFIKFNRFKYEVSFVNLL